MNDLREEPQASPGSVRSTVEDQWVDQVMPDEFDWVSVVQEHPFVSLSVAAVGGFLLGRWQGQEIIDAVSELAAAKLSSSVDRVLGA